MIPSTPGTTALVRKAKKYRKLWVIHFCQYFLFIGMCSTMCNWETENWFVFFLLNFRDFISISLILISTCPLSRCDMGTDANGCWMGNWCQDMSLGEIYMQKTMFQKVLKKRTNLSLETFSLPPSTFGIKCFHTFKLKV